MRGRLLLGEPRDSGRREGGQTKCELKVDLGLVRDLEGRGRRRRQPRGLWLGCLVVSCALTWKGGEKSALGAASAVRAANTSDQSVLVTVTIVGQLRRRPRVNGGWSAKLLLCFDSMSERRIFICLFVYLFTYLFTY